MIQLINPLTLTVAVWPEHQCLDDKNYKWWLNLWHRMLYSCTRMATVGIKGFKTVTIFVYNKNQQPR